METQVIEIEKRTLCGKANARKLRKSGKIPGILYGHKEEPVLMSLDPHALRLSLQHAGVGRNTLFKLSGVGREVVAMIKDLQKDPIRGTFLHIDFIEVREGDSVIVDIPMVYHGRPAGVVAGGVLQSTQRSLRVSSSPLSIPKSVEIDISNMQIGDVITIGDLTLPDGVKAIFEDKFKVAMVKAPRTDKAATEEGEEEEAA